MPDATITVLRHRSCEDLPPPGIDHCVTSLEQAVRLRPQAAVIANPASHHLESARALADAGVHLMIEKPIAHTSRGVPELIASCRARRIVLMTGYNLRFSPSLQHFQSVLRDKRVGRVLSVRAEVGQYLPSWRPDSDYRDGVSARAELGGGVLLELSHEIDYLRWMLGEVRWVSAVVRKQSSLEIDVEDVAHLALGFDSPGTDGDLAASLSMDCVRQDTTRTCSVIGESGTLRWDAVRGTVELFERGAAAWSTLFAHHPQPDESYVEEWRHFLDCILHERPPLVSGSDGLEVLRVVEAARLSSSSRAVVPIAHDDSRPRLS
jgi:predicted dehydrogenase